jgi:DnaJ-class molecular chaperone
MSGAAGCVSVQVPCAACNGTGSIKAITEAFEVRLVQCERCEGKKVVLVLRKQPAQQAI